MRIRHWRSQLRHRPTAPKYSIVREDPTMEAGEAGGEDSRDLLLFRSDFSGFEQLEPRDGSSGGSSEVDSDVEDVIYAHMYFEEFQEVLDGENSNHQNTVNSAAGDEVRDGLSVSLLLDPPKSKVKKKKKRRTNKKISKRLAPPPHPTGAAAVAGGSPHVRDTNDDDDTTTATDSQDEVVLGLKVDEGVGEPEMDLRSENLNADPGSRGRSARGEPSGHASSEDAVVVISSDSDIEIVKGSKFSRDTVPSDDVIEIVSSDDGSESSEEEEEEEGEGEELGAGLEEGEEGEASSDMQLSDQEQEGESSSLDPWHINLKDKLGREAYDSRYGNSGGRFYGKNNSKCANCKQRYHIARNCPWPKRHQVCYLCGGVDHISSQCPSDLCTYCYQEKHRGRSCSAPWASPRTQCQRCFMMGHHAAICPDLWRQFHNTTYASHRLALIDGKDQRRFDHVFCCNCSQPQHYCFECTRTRPRGWPQPHLPLIAKYDLNSWPPHNLHQVRQQMGIAGGQEVMENHQDHEERKRKLSGEDISGDSPRKRSRGGRNRKRKLDSSRDKDFEERRKNLEKVSIGSHPALRKKQRSDVGGHSSKLLDRRSNSLNDTGLLTNRGSPSLLGTPTWSHDSPHPSSSLLPTPVTPPAGVMLPPLRSHSSHSSERRRAGEKRSLHHSLEDHYHRRDSEPASQRPRLTEHRHSLGTGAGEDFPREPLFATPPSYHDHTPPQHSSTPYYPAPPPRRAHSDVSKRFHHQHHDNDQPHSSREDRYHHPNSAHEPRPLHQEDARERRMSYNEGPNRGALPPYHRRLSDISEQSGGVRTPPTFDHNGTDNRHKRHRTEDGWMVNDRGFRGQPHLMRNNYRH